ncbi:MAG: hypothetical protein A3F18_02800 [Legionellales bacterium RIFCSPHIGHO2_12_FULL_37_14]|nr:MAG: hypothetical protein A3F18_02800 [Legionellales bacterium RIFCSPHIGHO2_12_FULL_37_14]
MNRDAKTVLIAIPVLLIGGTEIQTLSVAKALISGGYRVIVCCYHEYDQTMVDQFAATGAKINLLRMRRDDTFFGLLRLTLRLVSLFGSLKPDVIHVQYISPGLISILSARLAMVPIVFATVHIAGSLVYGIKAKLMLRFAAKLCSAFICVSKGVEDFWFGSSAVFDANKHPKRRTHFTIYNAVDPASIAWESTKDVYNLRHALALQGRLVIGIVGRLAVQKGHTILLDALAEIKKKVSNVILIVIGDGPEREILQRKAARLALTDSILWLGAQAQQDVFRYYQVMNILVMPSLYEGFGLTAIEAMAFGLPVVGSNVAGLSEVIEHEKSGLLVRPGDADELKIALLRLINDKELIPKFGAYGKLRVDAYFSLQAFEQSMHAMYRCYVGGVCDPCQ